MTQTAKPFLVYQCEGPSETVGMEIDRFPFRGMAQKLADRLNDEAISKNRTERYTVRDESKE